MINKIKELCCLAIDEDYHYNKDVRKSALELWEQVRVDVIHRNFYEDWKLNNKYPCLYQEYTDDLGNKIKVGFTLRYIGGSDIAEHPQQAAFDPDNSLIIMTIPNYNFDQITWNKVNRIRLLEAVRKDFNRLKVSTFIHEYTHFIDEISEYTIPDAKGKEYVSPLDGEEVSYTEYADQPVEVSARIQQTFHEIDDELESILYSEKLNYFKTFDIFEEFVKVFSPSYRKFIKYSSSEIKRKMNEKLYTYYENRKREIELALKEDFILKREVERACTWNEGGFESMISQSTGSIKTLLYKTMVRKNLDYLLFDELTNKVSDIYDENKDRVVLELLHKKYPKLTKLIDERYEGTK